MMVSTNLGKQMAGGGGGGNLWIGMLLVEAGLIGTAAILESQSVGSHTAIGFRSSRIA